MQAVGPTATTGRGVKMASSNNRPSNMILLLRENFLEAFRPGKSRADKDMIETLLLSGFIFLWGG